jgi:LuxR family maltose regulon positive regulatory protein
MMKVLSVKGDFDGAEKIIDKLEKLKLVSDLPYSFSLLTEAGKAKVWLLQGKMEHVGRWLQENNYSRTDEIVASREDDEIVAYRDLGHIILARYKFANGEIDECIYLLEKLSFFQEKLGRQLLLLEVLLLKAQVLEIKDDMTAAMDAVKRALYLGEKGMCIRVFLNEGRSVARIIKRLVDEKHDIPRPFALKLLAEFTIDAASESRRPQQPEMLSERELEILRLVASGMSNKTIMEQLYISLSTVKTHLRNIYSKLDAHSRTEAIAKANKLRLL